MIIINKKYKLEGGVAPFKYLVTTTAGANVSITTPSGTATDFLEVSFNISENYRDPFVVTINIEDSEGCENFLTQELQNPCPSEWGGDIISTAPKEFVMSIASPSTYTYKWYSVTGIELAYNADYCKILSIAPNINDNFPLYCEVISPAGCKHTFTYNYTKCRVVFESHAVLGHCLQQSATYDKRLFEAMKFSIATGVDFGDFTPTRCSGASLVWSTLKVYGVSPEVVIYRDPVNITLITILAPQGNAIYEIRYTIQDTDKNEYSGVINYTTASCISPSGCLKITNPTQTVTINCDDVQLSAPYYQMDTDILYTGTTSVDWSTFQFYIPTCKAGTPNCTNGLRDDYSLNADKNELTTPLGVATQGAGKINYVINNDPSDEIEQIYWSVCNKDKTCCSSGNYTIFSHVCNPKPTANNISDCLICNTPKTLNMALHTDTQGKPVVSYNINVVTPTGLVVVPNLSKQELTFNAPNLTGTATIKYRVEVAGGLLSEEKTITLDITCAGLSSTITKC